jgi:cobyrinic acid a,c-diamide synthase
VNNVGSEKHAQSIRRSLKAINVPVVGMIQKEAPRIPSRHLGLYMGAETSLTSGALQSIRDSLDVSSIQTLAGEITARAPPTPHVNRTIDVGIAYDAAFCFYYRSNIEAIERRSNVTFFSPVRDSLPEVDALYFGGGYPELYATELSANRGILGDVKTQALEGMPMYGECGGLMYLSRSLTTTDGRRTALANVLPADIQMTARRQALGHAAAEAIRECAIAHQGDALRGHEYHYSTASVDTDARFAYRMTKGEGISGYDGIMENNVVASYLHTHVYSMPREFDLFIERAAAYSRS